jgi:hypothetical protein
VLCYFSQWSYADLPEPIYDLFLSYSSHDRPWAEKLYLDMRADFPSINTFWDRAAITPGGNWRTILTDANFNTTNLLVLWSNAAAPPQSQEVTMEIAHFHADKNLRPRLGDSGRSEFPLLLDGAYPGANALQGFPALAAAYDPNATDRGISNLSAGQPQLEWRRMIQQIGDAIVGTNGAKPVIAAIAATNARLVPLLDQIRGLAQSQDGPTLDDFLQRYGLDWNGVRDRYGPRATDWRPYGGPETIVDLLEDLRVKANARLDPAYWFRWEYADIAAPDPTFAAKKRLLHKLPSVVLIDPISLYHPLCANALRDLDVSLRHDQSVIVSLSPVASSDEDWLAKALRFQSIPLFEDYFDPKVPPAGRSEFARCALGVSRIREIERLVRYRISFSELAAKEEEARDTTGMVRS